MKLIPTGIENFKTMIDKNAYYVDKTNLIADILNEQVVLYTRPRRFGKTLNMSMLYYFFSHKEKDNAYLFDGLNVSKENLNTYLRSLTDARHNLLHENIRHSDFMTIEIYIAWFPLFFLIIFFEDKMTKKDIVRLIFFLKLLQLDFKKWNKKDTKNYSKMTCLEVYAQYTRTIITQLDRNNNEVISACLDG